jgi:hypothetical protein
MDSESDSVRRVRDAGDLDDVGAADMNRRRLEKLWKELVYTHERVATGPTSDRRTLAAYRNGILTAYAIITGQSEEQVRVDLMGSETFR